MLFRVEKGALFNAVGPYLEDEMRRLNRYIQVNPLTHANTKNLTALYGLYKVEHKEVKLN